MRRCLVIDDDNLFRRMTSDVLREGNFQAVCAASDREMRAALLEREKTAALGLPVFRLPGL